VKGWLPLIVAAALLLLTLGHQWAGTVIDPQPKPPTPDVVPTPVDPDTDPIPVPAETRGLRVLFVYESSAALTIEQQNVLYSTAVRAWLNENCAKSPEGHPEWRCWDKDTDATSEGELWQAVWTYAKPKLGPLPCVLILRDTSGKIHDLPSEAELMRLLKGGA
jgi:hypothetical protein